MIRKLFAKMCYSQARWALSLGRSGLPHAYRLLRLSCALWPRHPQACQWLGYLRGRIALESGHPQQAIELLREANRVLPEAPAVRASLGLAYTMAGQDEQAIPALERALKDDPIAAGEAVWAALAWSYLRSGRAVKAREVCLRAAELEIRSPRLDLLHRLANGVELSSLPVLELRELVKTVPESASLLLDYARLQAQEGRHRLARAAVSVLPDDQEARAYSIISHASLNVNDPVTAAWAAEQILRTGDEQYCPEAALLRSEVSLRRGDTQEAIAQARRGLESDPQQGRLREQLGRALLVEGKWDEAGVEMSAALQTGQAGALAAGVVALAAPQTNNATPAVPLGSRPADQLTSVVVTTAQALNLASQGRPDEALALVETALGELNALPVWARSQPVVARLAGVLEASLQLIATAGDEPAAQRARAALRQLR